MENSEKIVKYIESGCKPDKKTGLELEHFVCDRDYGIIPYSLLSECFWELCTLTGGKALLEKGKIFGVICEDFLLSTEPGCQLEISIAPFSEISDIEAVYSKIRRSCDEVFEKRGYSLLQSGVFPLVENGSITPDDIELLPKDRYILMDKYFQGSGRLGKYMMRATSATQVSIDFSSPADALKKLGVLSKLSPILSLISENKSGIGRDKKWKKHLIRNQIWREVDKARTGFFEGFCEEAYSLSDYANHILKNPCILIKKGDETVYTNNLPANELGLSFDDGEIEHVLSMFFPWVRLKKYIEYRVADSLPPKRAMGYAALIKTICYNEQILNLLDRELGRMSVADIYRAEDSIMEEGYHATVYGKPVLWWMDLIFDTVMKNAAPKDREYIKQLLPLPLINYRYKRVIEGAEENHRESAVGIREYLANSTAKYHNRVVRTMYLPKLFTHRETEIFQGLVGELYGIFDKVIAEFFENPAYRELFGFPRVLNELILREKKYCCSIPIARIDVFLNEETGDFKFCEFNTDGTSAMNEDRELNIAFSQSKAYREFSKEHELGSFELFDTWVEEAVRLYGEFSQSTSLPNVAIVDFMENATTNEFIIFSQRFKKAGMRAELCDIRELKWENGECRTPAGMRVDLIYRRAVTSDILKNLDSVGAFLSAVRSDRVCLLGDLRTQIVHNKILFKILHLPETMRLLTRREQEFIRAHVPLTISLDELFTPERSELFSEVTKNREGWIIKPEDSYGSYGVFAGVELEDEEGFREALEKSRGKRYILQEFCTPYSLPNIDLTGEDIKWVRVSNLSGLFVYNGKFKGVYSRISLDKMISTQYNEMSVPTVLVR